MIRHTNPVECPWFYDVCHCEDLMPCGNCGEQYDGDGQDCPCGDDACPIDSAVCSRCFKAIRRNVLATVASPRDEQPR